MEIRKPLLTHHGQGDGASAPMLPSFPSLREKNLRTLYGDTVIGGYVGSDKSPKGSVDEKIRPLVDLINSHPHYITLSSCSGRVALFDPGGCCDGSEDANDSPDGMDGGESEEGSSRPKQIKGTERSGKGRGKWLFVTHDILPNLGPRIMQALQTAGQGRGESASNQQSITFKHEPPLLHVGASSLAAGKRLLHLAKSTCAMRESGLVVTDSRVTVELRTTGTMLCVPLMVGAGQTPSLEPGEGYLRVLAEMANERMRQNEVLLEKLRVAVQDELFEAGENDPTRRLGQSTAIAGREGRSGFEVTLQPLPELNLWKTATAVLPRNDADGESIDVDVLAFGGQGIGPKMDALSSGKAPTCRRWNAVFRLSRRDGIWSDRWDTVPVASSDSLARDTVASADSNGSGETTFCTTAGTFCVQPVGGIGPREGHSACTLPRSDATETSQPSSSAVAIFGGRTGGPLSPSNDFFIFAMSSTHGSEEVGMFGRPTDVRGAPPEPRFGHSMTVLRKRVGSVQSGEHVAVVAGGTGVSSSGGVAVSLSSVHVLSRVVGNESELSHFVWERVADMPSPRSYHTAFIDESGLVFVFGGIGDAGDPFGPIDATGNQTSHFRMSLFGNDAATNSDTGLDEIQPLVGSAMATLELDSNDVVLQVGGTKSPDNSLNSKPGHGAQTPINIFSFRSERSESPSLLERARISSIELVENGKKEGESIGDVDLGACVHHCLVALPKRRDDGTASAIIVGGGVPSFSFGQSYARSYLITAKEVSCGADATMLADNQTAQITKHSKSPTLATSNRQAIDGKYESNAIYVPARHAKEVKVKLESLGFLDKRYKMVKVPGKDPAETVVAIPVTQQCVSQPLGVEHSLGFGKEIVPLSSSSIGKMKQGKALR